MQPTLRLRLRAADAFVRPLKNSPRNKANFIRCENILMSKIEKTAVSLTILGQTIQPDEITQLLGCRPTQAAKTGDRIPLSNGKTRLVKIGFWKLDYGVIDAIELDQKIEQLLEPLTSDLKTWDQIAQSGAIELF